MFCGVMQIDLDYITVVILELEGHWRPLHQWLSKCGLWTPGVPTVPSREYKDYLNSDIVSLFGLS